MTRLVGQGAVHLVAGEFAGCAQSGAVELSRPLGVWCAKLAGNMLWRAVWPAVPSFLGQQKGWLNRATLRGCFCPAVGRCRPVPQKGLSFRRRQPTSSGEGAAGVPPCPFATWRASYGPFERRQLRLVSTLARDGFKGRTPSGPERCVPATELHPDYSWIAVLQQRIRENRSTSGYVT